MSRLSATCPRCGTPGRSAPVTTVEHLVSAKNRCGLVDGVMFCATKTCDVVYFVPDGLVVPKAAVTVRVFQKEANEDRPVCYCFEHSVADVIAAIRPDGSNSIVDEITEACRHHLDRCEETNPQGRCCLGNVRSVLRADTNDSLACRSCGAGESA
jgi:hypothetical protein